MAGMAAALLSQTIFVSPTSGVIPLVKGLTIALLGGLGSVPGAMIGALLVGVASAKPQRAGKKRPARPSGGAGSPKFKISRVWSSYHAQGSSETFVLSSLSEW